MAPKSDAYTGMTARDKKILETLEERNKGHDGFYRAGEDEFSQTFSAESRSLQNDPRMEEAAVQEQSEYIEAVHGWCEITTMFHKADSNGNGFIERQELESVLSCLAMDKDAMDQIFRSLDVDANGCIDIEEFVKWMQTGGSSSNAIKQALQPGQKQMQTSPEARPKVKVKVKAHRTSAENVREALRNIFKQWDTDGSGNIGRSEFQAAMAKTGLNPTTVDKMFNFADADKSGSISIDEFIGWAFKEVMPVAEFQELQLNQAANVARLRPQTR